jgi:hypothetical protein
MIAMGMVCAAPAAAADGDGSARGAGQRARGLALSGGHDARSAWMVANYRDVHFRKRNDKATLETVFEFRVAQDIVTVQVGKERLSVSRGRTSIVVDSVEALQKVQQLLGGSAAVFAAQGLLSELEPVSSYDAPETSLLAAAALVASLVGDTGAPQRVADRFVAKHRGLYRQAGQISEEKPWCWSSYSKDVTASWDDLQACMSDAANRGFFTAAYERLACNTIWILRTESAWFQYLNCLSPVNLVGK